MWTRLAAQLRGSARAHVLTVAASNYYLAGDAVRVGMAIDHAQDAVTAAGLHLPKPGRVPQRRRPGRVSLPSPASINSCQGRGVRGLRRLGSAGRRAHG
jgi:hypothetical protein